MAVVVILGGGIGGVVAANRLRKRLPAQHEVKLIERQPLVSFQPAYLRVLDGRRAPSAITRDLRQLERRNIQVVEADVLGVDLAQHRVGTSGGTVEYDYLVAALGAELAPQAVPGFAEGSHNLYSLAGNESLRDALGRFTGGRVAVVAAALPYKCPAAPYEAALLIDAMLRRRGVRDRSSIELFVPEPAPLPVAGPIVGAQVQRLLQARNIEYHPVSRLTSVDPERKLLTFEDGTAPYDLLGGVPAHVAPSALAGSGIVNDAGWVAVDRESLETGSTDVFAIGDVTAIPLGEGRLLPKAGVFAHGEAEAVAQTIAARITGHGDEGRFDGHGSCFVEVGNGRAAYAAGDFYSPDAQAVSLRGPGRRWLWQKSLFERYWLWRWY